MRSAISMFLFEEDEKFFGEGPFRLLRMIEQTGTLRSAAKELDLSYSKALKMIHCAEKCLGYSLTEKSIGGQGGGGSTLTTEAKEFLVKYETYRKACIQANEQIFREVFNE